MGRVVAVVEALALLGAGVVAGIVSTVVSLASVVSYPALLAIGLRPLSANMPRTGSLPFPRALAAATACDARAGQALAGGRGGAAGRSMAVTSGRPAGS